MDYLSKISKLLGASKEMVSWLEVRMEEVSNKKGVLNEIVRENEHQTREKLADLGLGKEGDFFKIDPQKIHQLLTEKAKASNDSLFKHFRKPDFSTEAGYRSMVNAAKELTGNMLGFYLKEEKAKELLRINPPQKIMRSLGYGDDLEKMIEKEDIFEIFCALRFIEDGDWLNEVFFKPYSDLTKDDFEKREIKIIVLPQKWAGAGKSFLEEKLHHMSHLKEMGIVFVIPTGSNLSGEILYLFFMTLHYAYEVDWHARLFERYSQEPNFAKKMIEALKVKASKDPLPKGDGVAWRVLSKYLAKKDPHDPRLFEPRINTEAWHYYSVSSVLKKFSNRFPEAGLGFWNDTQAVADFFSFDGGEELISFNLFDNGISLLHKADFESRYCYHQQEAIWNKVFIDYLGEPRMDESLMDNLCKGHLIL